MCEIAFAVASRSKILIDMFCFMITGLIAMLMIIIVIIMIMMVMIIIMI